MFLFCLDEGEKTKHDSMYDAFPNVAKKRKPSRQEVTDFALVPKAPACLASFCFLYKAKDESYLAHN